MSNKTYAVLLLKKASYLHRCNNFFRKYKPSLVTDRLQLTFFFIKRNLKVKSPVSEERVCLLSKAVVKADVF